MKKLLLAVMILTACSLLITGCSKVEKPTADSVILDVEEYAQYFQNHLKDDEFVGYVAKLTYGDESRLYGLVFQNPDGDYIKTPLEALIILEGQGDYDLVNRCKIQSEETGGFEYPIGTGDFYNGEVLNTGEYILIQGVEPSFSHYPVIHQVLADGEDLLDFYETTKGEGNFIPLEGEYYTMIDNSWNRLVTNEGKITYEPIDPEDFRPEVEPQDVVISYEYPNGSPDNPVFKVNGEEAPMITEEYGGTALRDTVKVEEGGKIYIFHTGENPMELEDDTVINGEYTPIDNAVTQGVGYACINPEDINGTLEIYLSYYADYWYTLPFQVGTAQSE